MREIKFRGKRKIDGKWIYGYLVKSDSNINNGKCYILGKLDSFDSIGSYKCQIGYFHEVIPETVGQYTGLKDKNGKEIYEGDIIKHCVYNNIFKVIWGIPNEDYAGWTAEYIKHMYNSKFDVLFNTDFIQCEIIGNIYENLEKENYNNEIQ